MGETTPTDRVNPYARHIQPRCRYHHLFRLQQGLATVGIYGKGDTRISNSNIKKQFIHFMYQSIHKFYLLSATRKFILWHNKNKN